MLKRWNLVKISQLKSNRLKLIAIKYRKYLKSEKKKKNRLKRSENGNIRSVLKIMSWNKGKNDISKMGNIEEIKELIKDKKPDILFINELNLKDTDDIGNMNIINYNFEHDLLYFSNGIARLGAWIKSYLVYSRIKHLEGNEEAVIALKIGYPNKKRFTLIGQYRQWSAIYKNKKFRKFEYTEQNERLKVFTEKISKLIESNNDIIILGDMNIDWKTFYMKEESKDSYQKNFNTMISSLKEDFIDKGLRQIMLDNTRYDTTLDHIYINNFNKLKRVYSDKTLVLIIV